MTYLLTTHRNTGYTVIELLIVIVVIGILTGLVVNGIQNSQVRSRDTQRITDVDTLHSKLESYYSDNGGYPNTFTISTLSNLSAETLKDPGGNALIIASPATDQVAAVGAANPGATHNYLYTSYPTGCGAITCTGYVLKAYIEQPTSDTPNPYVRYGLNNN